jgi:hypothetical protein
MRRRIGLREPRGYQPRAVCSRARTSSQEPPGFSELVIAARTCAPDSALVAYLDAGESGPAITARLPRRADVGEDARVRLAVDVDRLYFFDSQRGRAIR